MWLKYGVNEEGILICIEDITRGKTSLKCPYCNGELTAKKGKLKEHHFAHNDQTCRPIANRKFPTLPLYDNFNVQLSSKDLAQLKLKKARVRSQKLPYQFLLSYSWVDKSRNVEKKCILNLT